MTSNGPDAASSAQTTDPAKSPAVFTGVDRVAAGSIGTIAGHAVLLIFEEWKLRWRDL